MIILVIAGYAIIFIYDFIPLYKQKLWIDFWTNTVLGLASFTLMFLLSINIMAPSPEGPIRQFIASIFGK